ncbi:MAG: SpoIIE family protein phosphatase, partial [Spirochaetota bacterium]|nr:SpoIIE family protein phosphatase [Spirochaetota bacterium]
MIKKIRNIIPLPLLVILNIAFIHMIIDFSKIYPFKRIAVGNVLIYKMYSADGSERHGSEIIQIEGEQIKDANLIKSLEHFRDKEVLNVLFKNDGKIFSKKIKKEALNKDLLYLLLFVLLIANIHYIWGYVIILLHPKRFEARIYYYFSLALSVFHIIMIQQFSIWGLKLLFIVIVFLFGFVILLAGYNIINKKVNWNALFAVLIIAIVIFISSFRILMKPPGFLLYDYIFLFLTACFIFTIVKMYSSILQSKDKKIIRHNLIVISVLSLGGIIQIIYLWIYLYYNLNLPLTLFSGFTLAIPLIIGHGMLLKSHYSFNLFNGKNIGLFVANFALAIIIALLIYYFLRTIGLSFNMTLSIFAFIILFIFLLNIKLRLAGETASSRSRSKSAYAASLQVIAEKVTSPEYLNVAGYLTKKMDDIFSEIIKITNASILKLVLFEDPLLNKYRFIRRYIEILPADSDLVRFFETDKTIIYIFTLMKNSLIEERIYKYLKKRKINFVIPIYREKKVKGAMFIGGKGRGESYSNDEMNYFNTVASQLYQLIENDILFRDYMDRGRYEKELDIASYVQLRLFPKVAPKERGLNISFYNRAYFKAIGDYFDFINIDDYRTAIIIGDIAGHGLRAAMVLSVVSSITHVMLQEKKSISETLEEINHYLNFRCDGVELVTFFISIYNKKTKEFEYINAGHR